MRAVAPDVLRHRAAAVQGVDAAHALASVRCLVLYLRASEDRVDAPRWRTPERGAPARALVSGGSMRGNAVSLVQPDRQPADVGDRRGRGMGRVPYVPLGVR